MPGFVVELLIHCRCPLQQVVQRRIPLEYEGYRGQNAPEVVSICLDYLPEVACMELYIFLYEIAAHFPEFDPGPVLHTVADIST